MATMKCKGKKAMLLVHIVASLDAMRLRHDVEG